MRQTARAPQKQRARDFSQALDLSGSPSWIRTSDTRINSPLLYRLSYRGIVEPRIVFTSDITVKHQIELCAFDASAGPCEWRDQLAM